CCDGARDRDRAAKYQDSFRHRLLRQRHFGRGSLGTLTGPTLFQIRFDTASASRIICASSIVSTLLLRMMNSPSTITDSISEGWPPWITAETSRPAGTRYGFIVSSTNRSAFFPTSREPIAFCWLTAREPPSVASARMSSG